MEDVLSGSIEPLSFEEPEQETEQFEQDALDLAQIGSDAKWQVIKDYCMERMTFYRNDLAGLDLKNMDLAKVGERYLVCSLVALELEALLSKVQVTTDAVREARKSQ